ncbi:MAG: MjaI family restriction endonuclease [Desulfamplus sp.]|nr:MjaI family restriction endonuclease [Desulfamplus sp.]
MAKEWILNSVLNRFQLNFKRNVGAVSEEIRKCSPKKLDDWEEYYFKNVRNRDHIVELGKKLYIKITEVVYAEIEEITEEDCINYMTQLVISRTYDGYTTEITTIYGQLSNLLDVKIEPSPDKWDRLYNVDFFIKVNEKYIGLQIKPVSSINSIPQIFKEKEIQKNTHIKFTDEFGGNVFYIFSIKDGKNKKIYNTEIIDEIRKEIVRLSR